MTQLLSGWMEGIKAELAEPSLSNIAHLSQSGTSCRTVNFYQRTRMVLALLFLIVFGSVLILQATAEIHLRHPLATPHDNANDMRREVWWI
jgi:hypothetical protein